MAERMLGYETPIARRGGAAEVVCLAASTGLVCMELVGLGLWRGVLPGSWAGWDLAAWVRRGAGGLVLIAGPGVMCYLLGFVAAECVMGRWGRKAEGQRVSWRARFWGLAAVTVSAIGMTLAIWQWMNIAI